MEQPPKVGKRAANALFESCLETHMQLYTAVAWWYRQKKLNFDAAAGKQFFKFWVHSVYPCPVVSNALKPS